MLYYDGEQWVDEWDENMTSLPGLIEVSLIGGEAAKEGEDQYQDQDKKRKGKPAMKSFVVSFSRFPKASKQGSEGTDGAAEQGTGEAVGDETGEAADEETGEQAVQDKDVR